MVGEDWTWSVRPAAREEPAGGAGVADMASKKTRRCEQRGVNAFYRHTFDESAPAHPSMHAPNVSPGAERLPNDGPVVQYDE